VGFFVSAGFDSLLLSPPDDEPPSLPPSFFAAFPLP